MTIADRVERVRARLADTDTDVNALLVSDLTNLRWLTGFTGSNGWAVVARDGLTLVTDGRYGAQAGQQLAAAGVEGTVLVGTSGAETMAHLASLCGLHDRVGFEGDHVSFAQHSRWVAAFDTELRPTAGIVEAEPVSYTHLTLPTSDLV